MPIKKGKRCLYCDALIKTTRLIDLLEEDVLCKKCRMALKGHFAKKKIHGLEVYFFYRYEGIFKTILLQYKEIYDEALKEVFLKPYLFWLPYYFRNYKVVYVPSSQKEISKRGFHHLKGIFEACAWEEFDAVELIEERSQKQKSKAEREKMRTNYRLTKDLDPDMKILIVDDVLTTGSSLKGVYSLFEGKCKKVKILCLALPPLPKKERAFKKSDKVL